VHHGKAGKKVGVKNDKRTMSSILPQDVDLSPHYRLAIWIVNFYEVLAKLDLDSSS
jgi:hypothetical protein